MIASLRGTLTHKSPTEITVDVNGIGYGVNIPLSTYEALGDRNAPVSLFTYLHVRDDALQLYGFATEEERDLFRLLISVTGIGPRMAQGILSGITVSDLRTHIAQADVGALTTIPGVGKKIAERLVVELRDRIGRLDFVPAAGPVDAVTRLRSEALLALTSLGYNRSAAERALRAAVQESKSNEASVEALIKAALRHASK